MILNIGITVIGLVYYYRTTNAGSTKKLATKRSANCYNY
jgi:hypothetical protein